MRRFVAAVLGLLVVAAGLVVSATAGSAVVRPVAARPAATVQAGSFHPVNSTRVLDTRRLGGLASGGVLRPPVAGAGAIPVDASAVTVNVTVLTPARSGSISVFPGDQAWNGAASISFTAGLTKQSMIIAVLGSNGSLAVRNNTGAPLQLIGDVAGYYLGGTAAGPGMFHPLGLNRVFDTRAAGAHPLAAGSSTPMPIAGHGGVPASGVGGVVANLTVLSPARSGSVSTYASGTVWDGSASESFVAGRSEQDVLSLGLGSDGAAVIRNNTAAPLQVVVDVIGYYLAGSPTDYGSYHPIATGRIYDSRNAPGQPVPSGQAAIAMPSKKQTDVAPELQTDPPPVPQWGVPAVLVRISVLTPSTAGSLSVYRGDQDWNGAASISFPAGVSTQQQLVAQLGPDGQLRLRNNAGTPLTVVVDVIGYYLGLPSPVHITSQQQIDPQRGNPSDISCPSLNFCVSVQDGGYYETWNGTTWSAPRQAGQATGLSSISCVSASFCMAIGDSSQYDYSVYRYDGSQWTTGPTLSKGYLPSISCPSTSFCMADAGGSYRTFDGTGWSAQGYELNGLLYPLSCTSASWCIGLDNHNGIASYDGTSWTGFTGSISIPGLTIEAATCSSRTFCVATGRGTSNVALYDGRSWTAAGSLDGGHPLQSVSCVSDTDCSALDDIGSVVTFDGRGWSAPVAVSPNLQGSGRIRCSAAGSCAVLDQSARATAAIFDGTSWGAPQRVDFPPGPLAGVSCSSSTFCMAVDAGGYALRYDGSSWATPVQLTDGVGLTAVSCTSTSRCVAVDSGGEAVSYDGSSWSTPVVADPDHGLYALSCAGPTFCAALDSSGQAVTFAGSSWSTPTAAASGDYLRLSCASADFCVAAGNTAAVFDGSKWTRNKTAPNFVSGLSCPTSGLCLATRYLSATAYDEVARWDGGGWSPVESLSGTPVLGNVSCASPASCLLATAGNQRGVLVGWSAAGWTMPVAPAIQLPGGVPSVSCPTSTFCMVLDGQATAYRLDG